MIEATFGTKPNNVIGRQFLNKLCARHRIESIEPAFATSRKDCDWCAITRATNNKKEPRICS